MAIEVCSETNSPGFSPRISFSHDLKNSNGSIPVEDLHLRSDLHLLDSTSDFVFSITNCFSQQFSSADELFSDGKIVPMEIKKVISNGIIVPIKKNSSANELFEPLQKTTVMKKRLKEFLSDETDVEEEKPLLSKHFWQFKRSSSLNFDTARQNRLIRSLQFLSRSHSTGSAPNPKQTELQKERQKQRLQKQSSVSSSRRSSSSSSTSSTYYFYNSSNKSSLRKCSSSNGVRISPVLNLPQAYIPKVTANFFGFGSLFCKGKVKRKKK